MLIDGLVIMIVGMLVVFFFLILIILAMKIMSGVVLKFFPEKEEVLPVRKKATADAEIAVAIAAAYQKS